MDTKIALIGVGLGIGLATMGYGLYHYFNSVTWPEDKAQLVMSDLDKLYEESRQAHLGNALAASLDFLVAARRALEAFKSDYIGFPEFLDWEIQYNQRVQELKQKLEKA